mgnify:CR=1 FL=1
MAFHEVRLPDFIERGAQGGPGFSTTIISLSSGFERRNIDWSQTRQSWDIGYGILGEDNTAAEFRISKILEFFYAREGRAHGFRFKDWTDHKIARQSIGLTDGSNATFAIFKRYTSGGIDYDRAVKKIVSGTVSLWVNNTAITEGAGAGEFSINLNTGIITLGATLAATTTQDVEVECEFDIPVRFDIDKMELNVFLADASSIPNITLVELRLDENGDG